MNPTKRSLCFGVCALLGFGCSTVEIRPGLHRVEIAESVFLNLPDANDIDKQVDATQLLVADYGERSFSFDVELEIRPGMITIASVNIWGGTLFAITYDGAELRSRGSIDTEGLDPEFLLADVLMTYWDPDWVSLHLEGAVLENNKQSRTVSRAGRPVIEISYESTERWPGRTHFVHRERGYELIIDTVNYSGS